MDNEQFKNTDFNQLSASSIYELLKDTDIDSLSISDLKEISSSLKISPEGDNRVKDNWVDAVKSFLADNAPEVIPLSSVESANENNGSREAQETFFDEILNKLETANVPVNTVSLRFDGKEALSYRNGELAKQQLTDKQMNSIQSALNDPQNFEGTITIKSGNRTLLKIENGQVIRDTLRLTSKALKVDLQSPNPAIYEKYSPSTSRTGWKKTEQTIRNAIKDGVGREQIKNVIRQEDGAYKAMAKNSPEAADDNLERIVNQVQAQNKFNSTQSQTKERSMAKSL